MSTFASSRVSRERGDRSLLGRLMDVEVHVQNLILLRQELIEVVQALYVWPRKFGFSRLGFLFLDEVVADDRRSVAGEQVVKVESCSRMVRVDKVH